MTKTCLNKNDLGNCVPHSTWKGTDACSNRGADTSNREALFVNATLTAEIHSSIDRYLGVRAEALLRPRNPKIPSARLYCPRPDVVERIYALPTGSQKFWVNLQRIFGDGKLADSDYFGPKNIVELAIEGGCNAVGSTFSALGMVARK